MKDEKALQSIFNQWIKSPLATPFWLLIDGKQTVFFELKCKSGNSLSWSDFRPKKKYILNQLEMAILIRESGIAYKIPDDAFAQKPLDCGFFYGQTFVVALFDKEKNNEEIFIIDPKLLLSLFKENGYKPIRKSLLIDYRLGGYEDDVMIFSLKPKIKVNIKID